MNKIILTAISIGFFTSCGIKNNLKTNLSSTAKTTKEIIHRVNKIKKSPESIYLKGRINITKDEKELSLNINIKCIKDSLIWASVTAPLGIEVFRIQLQKDSIYFINRLKKTYFIKPTLEIKDYLKTDLFFEDVYNIITGNLKIEKGLYKLNLYDSCYVINSKNREYKIDRINERITEATFSKKNSSFNCIFSDFKEEKGYIFPKNCLVESDFTEKLVIKFIYDRVIFDKNNNISFTIPNHYVKIQ